MKKNQNHKLPTLVTTNQMAEILGISKKTLLNWVENKLIPVHRKNKTLRFQASEVLAATYIKNKEYKND